MDIPALERRHDTNPANAAMESLERLLGEHRGRAMWLDVCARAGVLPRATPTPDELRLIARELTEVPGPAALIGRTLSSFVTLYGEILRGRTGVA